MKDIDKLAAWKVLQSKTEIDNRFLKVHNVTFKLPNDKIMEDYFIAEKTAVAVIVTLMEGKTSLIKEWERGVREIGHKFPSGRIDQGEEPDAGAARELREELGVVSNELLFLGEAYVDPGFMTTVVYYYLCADFAQGDTPEDDPYELFEGEWIDFNTIEAMIYSNEIKNPFVIVAYFLAKNRLESLKE
jgi:ADP-ribose pyrophosphatase